MIGSQKIADDTNSSHSITSTIQVVQFPCLGDNYGYLLHDAFTGNTAAIDTPDAHAYQIELNKRGWKLTHIFNTHHHWDHVGGNSELNSADVTVYGPKKEHDRIPCIDVGLTEHDQVMFGSTEAIVFDVGGHTLGHIAYYFPKEKIVFVGDSLFSLGCGRMFEGTAEQFWASLQRLRSLPDDTLIYCAHEYTLGNAKFAMSVEPSNSDLRRRFEEVKVKRARNEPTVPSLLGDEKKTNPFLRVDASQELRRNVGTLDGEDDAHVFLRLRQAKDKF